MVSKVALQISNLTERVRISLSAHYNLRGQETLMSRKDDQEALGINISTATSSLRKQIMYSMAKELNRDICYQCNKRIETLKQFSIEHKVPWRKSGKEKELFFSMDNIAFSHNSCNIRAGRKTRPKPKCGSVSQYSYGCRCKLCKTAKSKYDGKRIYNSEKRAESYKRLGH